MKKKPFYFKMGIYFLEQKSTDLNMAKENISTAIWNRLCKSGELSVQMPCKKSPFAVLIFIQKNVQKNDISISS